MTHISIDQQHALALFRERGSHIHRHRRLAFARIGGSDDNDIRLVQIFRSDEGNIRGQSANFLSSTTARLGNDGGNAVGYGMSLRHRCKYWITDNGLHV